MGAKFSSGSGATVFYDDGPITAPSGEQGTQRNEFEAAIKSVTSSTTVGAVFLYDCRLDSDGGAWRKKCAGLSWYDEAASATRSARSEFPSVALIVADNVGTAQTLTVYDLDDVAAPLWFKFTANGSSAANSFWCADRDASSVFALNGRIYVGLNVVSESSGLCIFDFANDTLERVGSSSTRGGVYHGVADRANGVTLTGAVTPIVNGVVNDVAATYLEGGELDSLGLVRPVTACATAGGVSVIHPNGSVVNSSSTGSKGKVAFNENGDLAVSASGDDIVDVTRNAALYSASWSDNYRIHDAGSHARDEILITDGYSTGQNKNIAATNYGWALGKGGLTLIKIDDGNPNNSAVAVVQSTHNTGYMVGDIRFAGLARSKSEDRSVKGNDLSTTGTISNAVVATDSEMVAYSGFSASNYLSRANHTDFDFGTGDFSIMFWVKTSDVSDVENYVARMDASLNAGDWTLLKAAGGAIQFYRYSTGWTKQVGSATGSVAANTWTQCVMLRRGTKYQIYINGKLSDDDSPQTNNLTLDNSGELSIGHALGNAGPADTSSLSLVRLSATAPTPQQVKEIYEAEAPLFRAGAKCLLAANQVNDLAYDSSTDLLHIASESTSSSKSLRGLEVVESLTSDGSLGLTAATAVDGITAAGGVLAAYDSAKVGVNLPAIDVRGDINTADTKLPDDGKLHFTGVTTDATKLKIPILPLAINESATVDVKFKGQQYNTPDGEYLQARIVRTIGRLADGSLTYRTATYTIIDETTSSMDADISAVYSTNISAEVTGKAATRIVWEVEVEVQRITEKQYER